MPDHKAIYSEEAVNYERLVSHEDDQGNILRAIQQVVNPAGLDVADLGAGTGRVRTAASSSRRHSRASA